MRKQPIYDRKYDRYDPDLEMDKIQARMRSEIAELRATGDGVCYHDPKLDDRLVREYPDGRKFFVIEDDQGRISEVPVELRAKAA